MLLSAESVDNYAALQLLEEYQVNVKWYQHFTRYVLIRLPDTYNITKTRLFKYIKNFTTQNENFQMKNSGCFHISSQNINCGYLLEPPRRGGSNEYPQSMLLSRNTENNLYPWKPQFYCIKVGFKEVKTL